MKPSKAMRASAYVSQLFAHLTNSAITVRNILEDGSPENKLSVDDIKRAAGEKNLLIIDKILDLSIDEESEAERVKQRKAERDAKAGRKLDDPDKRDKPPGKKRR